MIQQRIYFKEVLAQNIRTGANMSEGCQLSVDNFLLGTAVKVQDLLSVPTVTSAKITFKDPAGIKIINEGAMVKEADGIYCYVWESLTTNAPGVYTVIIKVIYGGKPSVIKKTFTLISP